MSELRCAYSAGAQRCVDSRSGATTGVASGTSSPVTWFGESMATLPSRPRLDDASIVLAVSSTNVSARMEMFPPLPAFAPATMAPPLRTTKSGSIVMLPHESCGVTPWAAALIVAVDKARAEAERIHGRLAKPPILVTDNGSNFLARKFRAHISGNLSQVRTRYRTPQQLGLLERFHQTLKQEEVYWNLYASPNECRDRLEDFRARYNEIRPHWALVPIEGGDPVTPADVYCRAVQVQLPAWQGWAKAARKKLDQLLAQDAKAA